MINKVCEVCGQSFETSYTWARMCKPCFISEKKAETEDLKEAVEYWRGKYEAAVNSNKNKVDFSPDVLKKLIYLCHPDKHNNSQAAHEITQFLLRLRG